MIHYFAAPATQKIVEYLRYGGREFYTRKEGREKKLMVKFLATQAYVDKMKSRTFLKDVEIKRIA